MTKQESAALNMAKIYPGAVAAAARKTRRARS